MMTDEQAKAVQEAAKTTDHALSSLEGFGRFVDDAFGYPIRETGGFLGDWIKFKRDNWRKACERAKEALDARGVEQARPIDAKYAVPMIEGAALEDDPLLQEMWAGLIANSLDPSKNFSPSKVFISILKEMEPVDALVLSKLCRNTATLHKVAEVMECLGGDSARHEATLSVLNLARLGLVIGMGLDHVVDLESIGSPFHFTSLATALINRTQVAV